MRPAGAAGSLEVGQSEAQRSFSEPEELVAPLGQGDIGDDEVVVRWERGVFQTMS